MRLTSSAFTEGRPIDGRFAATDRTEGVSPGVTWADPPEGTLSVALTVIDRHPVAREFVHWAVVDLPPAGSVPEDASGSLPEGRELRNTTGSRGWHGPKPPAGSGPHPYELAVHALSVPEIDIADAPDTETLQQTLTDHALQSESITATYER